MRLTPEYLAHCGGLFAVEDWVSRMIKDLHDPGCIKTFEVVGPWVAEVHRQAPGRTSPRGPSSKGYADFKGGERLKLQRVFVAEKPSSQVLDVMARFVPVPGGGPGPTGLIALELPLEEAFVRFSGLKEWTGLPPELERGIERAATLAATAALQKSELWGTW